MDSIATAVISHKVNQVTKGLGDAVGLNDDGRDNSAAREAAQAKERIRRDREMQKREKEREARKKEREVERDKIREKYQLLDTKKAPPTKSSSRQQDDDSKCVIS